MKGNEKKLCTECYFFFFCGNILGKKEECTSFLWCLKCRILLTFVKKRELLYIFGDCVTPYFILYTLDLVFLYLFFLVEISLPPVL